MMLLLSPLLALTLASTTFSSGATVPRTIVAKDCGGENISPELHWSHAPKGTKSFALVVHDPDAPRPGGFYHWAIASIPANVDRLAPGTTQYPNYYGPCPPPGKIHHYHFTLYALDEVIDNSAPLDALEVLQHVRGHVLQQSTLTGLYATSSP